MFLVEVHMSYDEAVEKTKELDEKHKEITLKYDKETRKKISYIREKYRNLAYFHTVRFYSLHFATYDGVKKIKMIIEEADRKMKEINPSLYADVIIIPISLDEIKKRGKLYEQIYYAICLQMAEAVYNHVKKLKSSVPSERSKKNITKLLNKFEELNVIGDARINEKIVELKEIITKSTEKIKEQILNDIEFLRSELQDMAKNI